MSGRPRLRKTVRKTSVICARSKGVRTLCGKALSQWQACSVPVDAASIDIERNLAGAGYPFPDRRRAIASVSAAWRLQRRETVATPWSISASSARLYRAGRGRATLRHICFATSTRPCLLSENAAQIGDRRIDVSACGFFTSWSIRVAACLSLPVAVAASIAKDHEFREKLAWDRREAFFRLGREFFFQQPSFASRLRPCRVTG